MSESQTYTEMSGRPPATDAEVSTAAYPILVPGSGAARATTKLAKASQIAALFGRGLVQGAQTTQNAVPIAIPGMPTIPAPGGMISLQGQIQAYDTVTGDTALWNIALCLSRLPYATLCQARGDVTPSLFEATGTMATLAASSPPQLSANTDGPVIILTGIAANPVLFGYLLTYTAVSAP